MAPYIEKREVQELSIVDFLARQNYFPRYKSGTEHFYHSMLRDDDAGPSFTVNDGKGVWMDRGNADPSRRGGGIVQLGSALWPDLSFVDVLNKIWEICNGNTYLPVVNYVPHRRDEPTLNTEYQYQLWDTRPIGNYKPITRYLDSRGLLEVADGRLWEVYYRDLKKPEREMPLYGVGWRNEHNNFEFSQLNGFKSSIGRKGISVIPGDPGHVQVFEAYFDYLSRLRFYPEGEKQPTVIVLNAVNMLVYALERLKAFPKVDVFMDRDGPGMNCAGLLMEQVPHAVDRSYEYEGFKDYNDLLKAALRQEQNDKGYDYAGRIGR